MIFDHAFIRADHSRPATPLLCAVKNPQIAQSGVAALLCDCTRPLRGQPGCNQPFGPSPCGDAISALPRYVPPHFKTHRLRGQNQFGAIRKSTNFGPPPSKFPLKIPDSHSSISKTTPHEKTHPVITPCCSFDCRFHRRRVRS
ncbi:hypothetical protein [Ereboglobus luteus]|uniref:hypothetical protein n=1 Tax=Ereboglobus luteus TaxID=1796921 RepID=UPI0012602B15|nr:hypothetical protein [Ereboglobus luteus]